MLNTLMSYKWPILIGCEAFAWIATLYMLIARYWIQSNIQFICATVLAGITGYVPHIILAILDFVKYKTINFFIAFILLLMIFALTLGKKLLTKVDYWIQSRVEHMRNS
ncbi:hypothetical protein SFC65_19105 [Priestia filamentosa]|uniref:hypothetical protein n=1 Tax=Priestia filamentosa TaxID=1402861 RepID=UPI003982870D